MTRASLFIDAKVMSQARVSGIGHAVRGLVRALQDDADARARFRMRLLAPLDGHARLRSLGLDHVEYVRLPLPIRGWDRWPSLPWLPPLDAMVGRGTFVFPHYGNWPLRSSPSLTFVHDLAFLRHPETVGGNLDLLTRNMRRWLERTTAVATVSDFSRGEIVELLQVSPERVFVVPWGVDRSLFHPRAGDDAQRLRIALGLPERYVLYLGNFEPRKNLLRLVAAYRALPVALRREHALVLAGGHAWRDEEIAESIAEAQAAGERVVRPTRHVADDELPLLVGGASLLAQPSLYEGFGIAPLQAMACGVPVLAGANSAQPEVGGDAAVYVDAGSVDDITSGMHAALTDEALRATLIARGERRAAGFDWSRSVAALLQAVDALAA
ncbi:MAG: glycosyltransferase family 4 protein [Candidatus Dormibacteraeota bacterium]|nr:glycosyltransferase family 4 protein [Candidatus Dormibacteraeota bacterium]MBV9524885.1 glycosyltransferase family 4 protein [Candidatus Dormibacteraeota bacterium]